MKPASAQAVLAAGESFAALPGEVRGGDIRSLSRSVCAINVADDDWVASVERMSDGKLPAEEVVP